MTKAEAIKEIQKHITDDLLDGSDWRVIVDYKDGKLLTTIWHEDEPMGEGYISNQKTIDTIFGMTPPGAALVVLNESAKLSVKWLEAHLEFATGFRDTIREGLDYLYEKMKAEYEDRKHDEEVKH